MPSTAVSPLTAAQMEIARLSEIGPSTVGSSGLLDRGLLGALGHLDDVETAVVADKAAALLNDFDRRVRHYEVVFEI